MSKKSRKFFGGIYTSSRTLNRGDRVAHRLKRCAIFGVGRIINVTHSATGERAAEVDWPTLNTIRLELTSDLKRVRR
jgi:hypothetical protein